MNNLNPVVTIDGPSSSGKGTIGRLLAKALNWHFLDSGSLYRALAFRMAQENITVNDNEEIKKLAEELDLKFEFFNGVQLLIRLNGEDVTQVLLTEKCGNNASQIAVFPQVRAALLEKQRDFRQPPGLVADGRDMGTVVFPDANLKIFLSASLSERTRRRYTQLKEQGINVSLTTIETELKIRDERDEKREFAPLKSAEDAVLVDTTHLSIAETVAQIEQLVREQLIF